MQWQQQRNRRKQQPAAAAAVAAWKLIGGVSLHVPSLERLVVMLPCHLTAPSWTMPIAVVVVVCAQRPLSTTRARASPARAATRCVAEKSVEASRRYGRLSSRPYPECCGSAESTSAARPCQHGTTCFPHTPPNQAAPHLPRSDQHPRSRRTSGLGRHRPPAQTSQHPLSAMPCNASSPQKASRSPSCQARHALHPSALSSSVRPCCVASPSYGWHRCSFGCPPRAMHS
mmetsp:Transcript_66770/g.129158  ORF Transcript_66770/g.129158 Transcript_66770/m.129158 type:complete len:229 (-) Transcript_66770:1321-2007(-)